MEKQSQNQKVFDYLQKHGSITALEMFERFYICCPHSIIRNLRKKYEISDIWENTKSGKRFKRWILDEQV
ncbi:MAG: hypothetical protein II201_01680 [Clostridia bacterium]|nr:hypothetical protein [Clostridia bacterium]